MKTWQACPKNPTAVIPCGNEKKGECIDLRFNKCKVDILHGHCPGSHNVKCCPVGQVDKGETTPRPPSAKENGPKPKDPGKLLKKLKELQDKVRKEKAVGSPDDIKYFDTKLLREVIFRYNNNESQAYNPYPEPSLKALKDGAAQLLNELRRKR